jgi:hypothetical protein
VSPYRPRGHEEELTPVCVVLGGDVEGDGHVELDDGGVSRSRD